MANERFDIFLPRSGDGVYEGLDMLRKWPFGLILLKITLSLFVFFLFLSIGHRVHMSRRTTQRQSVLLVGLVCLSDTGADSFLSSLSTFISHVDCVHSLYQTH
jgi:hypothetical protein